MNRRRLLLHLLFVSLLTASCYPLLWLLHIWSGTSLSLAGVLMLVWFFCMWAGTAYPLLLHRKFYRRPRIMNGSIWLLSLAIAAAAYFAVPFSNGLLCGAYGIAAAACFWGGTKLVMLPLERMTHPYVLIGIAALDCVVGFLLYLSSSSLPVWITLLLFGADCCFFAWMHNGHAVESLLSGRGNESWEMPKEIRRSNFCLMGIFCAAGALLLLCYRPAAMVLRKIWRWIYTGIWYALRWLLSRGTTEHTADMPSETEQHLETLPMSSSHWLHDLLLLLILAALVGILIWKRREVQQVLISAYHAVRRWILARLGRTQKALPETDGAYCDYVEDLLHQEQTWKAGEPSISGRQWKQRYRQYRRMKPDTARYRLGYALFLAKIPDKVHQICCSPAEILQQMQEQNRASAEMALVTERYMQIRYGMVTPEASDFDTMDLLLKQMAHNGE